VDFRRFAPIVAHGKVVANDPLGSAVVAARIPGMKLQRRRVTFRVEGVLRGQLRSFGQLVNFEFYEAADKRAWRYHSKTFEAEVGERYLFFLFEEDDDSAKPIAGETKHSGGLRAIGDVGPFSKLIAAGLQGGSRDSNESATETAFEQRVAYLLLRPGDEANERLFVEQLAENVTYVRSLAGSLITFNLLRDLLKRSEPAIRKEACAELMDKFPGQGECLTFLQKDSIFVNDDDVRFGLLVKKSLRVDGSLLQRLKDPAKLWCTSVLTTPCKDDYEELVILTMHSQRRIRELACLATKRFFPHSEMPPGCASHAKNGSQ
jgi:hypothetical protein